MFRLRRALRLEQPHQPIREAAHPTPRSPTKTLSKPKPTCIDAVGMIGTPKEIAMRFLIC